MTEAESTLIAYLRDRNTQLENDLAHEWEYKKMLIEKMFTLAEENQKLRLELKHE